MFVIYVSLWPLVVCCWNLPPPSDYRELGRKDRRRKWREMGREKVSQTLLFRNRQERPHRGRRSLGAKERIQDVTPRHPSRKGTRAEIRKATSTNRTQYLYSSSFPQHLIQYKLFYFIFCAIPVQSALLFAKQGSFSASSNRAVALSRSDHLCFNST